MTNPARIKLEQHLAWPETRISNLLTWLDRDDMEGWDNTTVMGLLYQQLSNADFTDEAHF